MFDNSLICDLNSAIPYDLRVRLNNQKVLLKSKSSFALVEKKLIPESIRSKQDILRAFFMDPNRETLSFNFTSKMLAQKMVDVFSVKIPSVSDRDIQHLYQLLRKASSPEKIVNTLKITSGVGVKHTKIIKNKLLNFTRHDAWLKERGLDNILGELLNNVQSSCLRQIAEKVSKREKIAGYIDLEFNHQKDSFFNISIREYGMPFDYTEYYEKNNAYTAELHDFDGFSDYSSKPVLFEDNNIVMVETPNRGRGIPLIDQLANDEFYIASIYHDSIVNGTKQKVFAFKINYVFMDNRVQFNSHSKQS
jgi:hypothetical protein